LRWNGQAPTRLRMRLTARWSLGSSPRAFTTSIRDLQRREGRRGGPEGAQHELLHLAPEGGMASRKLLQLASVTSQSGSNRRMVWSRWSRSMISSLSTRW
jgi:3-oxoacyl-ACP reductase-like protein